MNLNFSFNHYRKVSIVAGTLLMFVLIELTRDNFSWFVGLGISIVLGLLLSFILENALDFIETKKDTKKETKK